MKVLVIIPAYNEEKSLYGLVTELNKYNVDVLVINDRSTDGTLDVCKQIRVNYIDLPCNLGIGGAVQTGYKYAFNHGYDFAIQLDGDGQHKPEYIENLISPLQNKEADMVIGSRYIKKEGFQSSKIRRLGIKYFSILIKIMTRKRITDPTSGFRACNAEVIRMFANNYPIDYPEPESIVSLLRSKRTIIEYPVIMLERQNGESSITIIKSIYYMVKVTLSIFIDSLRKRTIA